MTVPNQTVKRDMLHKSGMMDDDSTTDGISFQKAGQPKRQREATLVHSLPLSQAALVCLFVYAMKTFAQKFSSKAPGTIM